jgi:hypothetical protein
VNVRRVVVAATAALGLLVTAPAEAATTIALDGKRTKSKAWSGELDQVAMPMSASTGRVPFQPLIEDCTSENACDVKELRLSLPKNTSKGSFVVQVVVELPLMAAVGLYDTKGDPIIVDDGLLLGPAFGGEYLYEYTLDISRYLMEPGRYRLAIINRGGQGPYKATVRWSAHPPDRRTRR